MVQRFVAVSCTIKNSAASEGVAKAATATAATSSFVCMCSSWVRRADITSAQHRLFRSDAHSHEFRRTLANTANKFRRNRRGVGGRYGLLLGSPAGSVDVGCDVDGGSDDGNESIRALSSSFSTCSLWRC